MEGSSTPFGCFGELLECSRRFSECSGEKLEFLKSLKIWSVGFGVRTLDRRYGPARKLRIPALGSRPLRKSPDLCREADGDPSESGPFREGPNHFGKVRTFSVWAAL